MDVLLVDNSATIYASMSSLCCGGANQRWVQVGMAGLRSWDLLNILERWCFTSSILFRIFHEGAHIILLEVHGEKGSVAISW
jgi:hypothetical protein